MALMCRSVPVRSQVASARRRSRRRRPRARRRRPSSKVATSRSARTAACTSGRASTAPVPSPSRSSRSISGTHAQGLERERVPGLGRAVPGDQASVASGASACATSAAAPAITPSRTTGIRSAAAPRMNPASAACSRPPNAASTPSGSLRVRPVQVQGPAHDLDLVRVGLLVDAGAVAGDLRRGGAGERGDQRGATRWCSRCPCRRSAGTGCPAATRSRAVSMPTSSAASASSRVIAGPCGQVRGAVRGPCAAPARSAAAARRSRRRRRRTPRRRPAWRRR